MSDIVAIGDETSIMCMKAVGVAVHPFDSSESDVGALASRLSRILSSGPRVCLVTEDFWKAHGELLERIKGTDPWPIFLTIPTISGKLEVNVEHLEKLTEKALGAKLRDEEENE